MTLSRAAGARPPPSGVGGHPARSVSGPAASSGGSTGHHGGGGDPAGADIVNPSIDLLQYYRSRIEEFERERDLFLQRFKDVEVTHEDVHKLKWEIKVREEEILELQKALSDANVYLYDEREAVLRLQAENDALRVQELEDRRRIQHLLALTQPVTQEVTFFRDCRPEKMTRYPSIEDGGALSGEPEPAAAADASASGGEESAPRAARAGAVGRTGFAVRRGGKGRGRGHRGGGSGRGGGHTHGDAGARGVSTSPVAPDDGHGGAAPAAHGGVLRTVFLPSERAEALVATVEQLRGQLDDFKKLSEERALAWRLDKEDREEAEKRRREDAEQKITALERELESSKARLLQATKDYLSLRHSSQVAARASKEEVAVLRATAQKATAEVAEVRARAAAEVDRVRVAADSDAEHFKEFTVMQSSQREDDLRLLKEQYAEVQAMYEARVKGLEDRLASLRTRYRDLERRRNLEIEGFTRDISSLRKAQSRLEVRAAEISLAAASPEHEHVSGTARLAADPFRTYDASVGGGGDRSRRAGAPGSGSARGAGGRRRGGPRAARPPPPPPPPRPAAAQQQQRALAAAAAAREAASGGGESLSGGEDASDAAAPVAAAAARRPREVEEFGPGFDAWQGGHGGPPELEAELNTLSARLHALETSNAFGLDGAGHDE